MFNASGLVVLTNAFDFFFLATKTSDLEITDQDGSIFIENIIGN